MLLKVFVKKDRRGNPLSESTFDIQFFEAKEINMFEIQNDKHDQDTWFTKHHLYLSNDEDDSKQVIVNLNTHGYEILTDGGACISRWVLLKEDIKNVDVSETHQEPLSSKPS